LSAAYSLASDLVRLSPAARVTEVGSDRGSGALPPTVGMLTMRPPPRFFMWGITRRDMRTAPMTLRSQSACHVSSSTFSKPAADEVPALLSRMSKATHRRSARFCEQDVDAPPLRGPRVDQPLAVSGPADVGDMGKHLPSGGLL